MTTQPQQPVIPEKFQDILDSTTVAHVATLGPHGEPQNTPVWFSWDGQRLRFSLTTARQKYRNLRRDPRVAVSLVDPQNQYRSIEIRGVARLEEDRDSSLADLLARKYLGVDKFPYHQPGDKRVAVIVEPQHITTYGS
jgi:PPOX class probable F420-dependent enzyme